MSNSQKYNVLLVDDHHLFIDGLQLAIDNLDNYKVIAKAGNGEEFLNQVAELAPDVVILDINMPKMNGEQAALAALKTNPNLKILTISSHTEEIYYYKMAKAGVRGFLNKQAGVEELKNALDTILQDEYYFPNKLIQEVLNIEHSFDLNLDGGVKLSKREVEVLQFISLGYTNHEIGEKLFISHKTVDNHRTKLIAKTKTKNSAHLVNYGIKHGYIS